MTNYFCKLLSHFLQINMHFLSSIIACFVTQVFLSLMSLAAAMPVIVDQDGKHYMMQIFSIQHAIDRSDQEISGTSGSGGYDGGYGSSSYGSGYGGSDYGSSYGGGGYSASSSAHLDSSGDLDSSHQDFSSGGGYDAGHGGDDGSQGISLDGGHNYVHSVPVSEHVEVTKPVAVPVYKHIGKVFLPSLLSRLQTVLEIAKVPKRKIVSVFFDM